MVVEMYYNIETEWPINVDPPVMFRHDGDTEQERYMLCPFYFLPIERNVYGEALNIWIN